MSNAGNAGCPGAVIRGLQLHGTCTEPLLLQQWAELSCPLFGRVRARAFLTDWLAGHAAATCPGHVLYTA